MKRLVVSFVVMLAGCATVAPPPSRAPAPAAAPAPETAVPIPAMPGVREPVPAAPPTGAPAPTAPGLSFREFVELNDTKLLDVYVGMSRETVDKHMSAHQTDRFANPYKRQVLRAKDGTIFEVLFYVTRAPSKGKPVTETQTTPLIFRDNKVVAIGRYQLKKLRRTLIN